MATTKAPDFTLKSLDGREVSLSAFQGKVVILAFWASGSRSVLPTLLDIEDKYKEHGLILLTINVMESQETVTKFLEELKPAPTVLLDPRSSAAARYSVSTFPTTFVVDGNGMIQVVKEGYGPAMGMELESEVCELLGIKPVVDQLEAVNERD